MLGFSTHTLPPTYDSRCNSATTETHENLKKRAYDQRIREIEHGAFFPLVFSCTGGMGRAAVAT